MAVCIVMPKAGNSVETCIMGEWLKKKGEKIEIGDPIFEYETDKSSFEYRAEKAGYLLETLVSEGDDVPVMDPVCYIGEQGETISVTKTEAKEPSATPQKEDIPTVDEVKALPETVKVIVMPKAGNSVETCIMSRWLKTVGDKISAGDVVFEYETDKASFEYRAEEDGVLLKMLVEEGSDVPVMEPVCYIGNGDEDIFLLTTVALASEKLGAKAAGETMLSADGAALKSSGGIRISPRAKKIAAQMDIKGYEVITGTGPNGRIIERDIRAFAKNYVAPEEQMTHTPVKPTERQIPAAEISSEYTDEKLSNIRKVIAKNMHESLSELAQLTNYTTFDATGLLTYRAKVKTVRETMGLPNITINDLILYAVSRTLLHHPDLNAHFFGDQIRHFHCVNLGMAVDTPRGLMVPTIFHAEMKSLSQISMEAKELVAACRDASINPDKLIGASFTVTNIGSFGVEMFTPIINPPQTGILGICSTTDRVRKKGNEIDIYPSMGLALTYDHRAVDGAPASRFLQELSAALEQFSLLLAK